ncbi:hypothetical protein E2C01_058684 [Portunus trituberculatus]|uniref:Uncharacterized protein n=1 Tax=Portunus trituberculatus TaxID=210409 RepID=A0A5B7H3V0_PORTR|nr:hypothetical protein [Portunus trituberculatus]
MCWSPLGGTCTTYYLTSPPRAAAGRRVTTANLPSRPLGRGVIGGTIHEGRRGATTRFHNDNHSPLPIPP